MEREAYQVFKAQTDGCPPHEAPGFTLPLLQRLAQDWSRWRESAQYPSRQPAGRTAQNPHLLQAFDALDRALANARRFSATSPKR